MGDQCPALAQAKYGFHIRGDTYGSNRLMDTLLSGSVPLFTNATVQQEILPDFIPWAHLGYDVDITSEAALKADLSKLLAQSPDEYARKLKTIQHYRPYLDHTQSGQFDLYMAHFALQLGLQSSVRSIDPQATEQS